jgi:hypothetical protein
VYRPLAADRAIAHNPTMLDDTAAAPEQRYFALLRRETSVAR